MSASTQSRQVQSRHDRVAELAAVLADLAAELARPADEPAEAVAAPVLLDIAEAARLLGVSRSKLYEGPIRRGELPTVRVDSRRLVPRAALDAYVAGLVEELP